MQVQAELSESFVSACERLRSATRQVYKNRQIVYTGKRSGKVFVVKRGYVQLISLQSDGRSWIRMLLGKGALIGDLPFSPGPFLRDEQAISSGSTCLIELDRRELEGQTEREGNFLLMLLKTISSQLQFTDRRMQWQLVSPLRIRIATALADLVCFAGGRCAHGHLIDVRLTHEEFSQIVVAARPVVSEVLGEFKAAGLIDYTRSHLCLLGIEELYAMAGMKPQNA